MMRDNISVLYKNNCQNMHYPTSYHPLQPLPHVNIIYKAIFTTTIDKE